MWWTRGTNWYEFWEDRGDFMETENRPDRPDCFNMFETIVGTIIWKPAFISLAREQYGEITDQARDILQLLPKYHFLWHSWGPLQILQ